MEYIFTVYNDIKTGILMADDKPMQIDCYEEDSLIGNIYVGRVSNILKNISAVFVDISKDLSCYFPLEDYKGEKALCVGERVLVQVTKDKIKTKQPTVSTNLTLTGNYVVVSSSGVVGVSNKIKDSDTRKRLHTYVDRAKDILREDKTYKEEQFASFGGILRTSAEAATEEEVVTEIVKLYKKLLEILFLGTTRANYTMLYKAPSLYLDRFAKLSSDGISVITDNEEIYNELTTNNIANVSLYTDSYEITKKYRFDHHLDKALSKNAYLRCGGYLVIEPTEAMTVIDVNSGKAIKGNGNQEKILEINKEAAAELARQLRLRNLSGIIIIDFISMKSEIHQKELLDYLRNCLKEDSTETTVVDITRLGLVEMTRKKVRKPLHEVIR